jgi:hypothetical protein
MTVNQWMEIAELIVQKPEAIRDLYRLYPLRRVEGILAAQKWAQEIIRDLIFSCATEEMVQEWGKYAPAWMYLFSATLGPIGTTLGLDSMHSFDLHYVFKNFFPGAPFTLGEHEMRIADEMSSRWASMARHGNPNGRPVRNPGDRVGLIPRDPLRNTREEKDRLEDSANTESSLVMSSDSVANGPARDVNPSLKNWGPLSPSIAPGVSADPARRFGFWPEYRNSGKILEFGIPDTRSRVSRLIDKAIDWVLFGDSGLQDIPTSRILDRESATNDQWPAKKKCEYWARQRPLPWIVHNKPERGFESRNEAIEYIERMIDMFDGKGLVVNENILPPMAVESSQIRDASSASEITNNVGDERL